MQKTRSRTWRAGAGVLSVAALAAALLPAAVSQAAPAPAAPAAAPDSDLWTPFAARLPETSSGKPRRVDPSKYAAYTLDAAGLDGLLDTAPREESGRAGSLLTVPSPEGDLVEFRIVESPVMEAGLAAAHPEIETYAGVAVDSAASIRLDVTPMGFHASVRSPGQASWYVDPAFNGDDSVYLSYLGSSLPAPEKGLIEPEGMAAEHAQQIAKGAKAGEAAPGDPVLHRTYRLALVTDTSYARYFGTENVLAEKVTLMNRVNQIYNDDFAIRMILIDETDKLNLDTAEKAWGANGPCGPVGCFAPDQFTAGCTGGLLNRNQFALGQLVGPENYDVGHIALGNNGGGVAGLGVVGGNGKARGCTGLPQPEGDYMAIDYVAHEIGHQFGGNHTFNGTQASCGGNKAAPSVEPGSGSSVMAYAGICQQDNIQPHTDPYFSQWSQQEITATITATPVVSEVQTVILSGFDTDGESFTLSYGGQTSAPIVRGAATYTTATIDAALEAILPAGGTVTVAALGGSGTLSDAGFQLTFSGTTNTLAGTDLPAVGVTPSEGVTAIVSETTKGAMRTNGGRTVETIANRTPVASAPATASIPLRTPFQLTGSATDADNDSMIYLWEQSDRGAGTGTSLVSQTKTNGPLFRVFGTFANVTPAGTLLLDSPGLNIADGNPTRTFPDMKQILENNTNAASGVCPAAPAAPASGGASNVPIPIVDCFSEWLPTADYVGSTQAGNSDPVALNFRFTARDMDPQGGGYSFANTKVLVDKTAGPFLVNSKNAAAAAIAGRTEAITWAVAGTNKPTLAENVKISLSTDGGATFPVVLNESTPNDGTEPVTWPNIGTEKARIKVEAVGNVFFDVNNADFQIVAKAVEAPETTITSGPADDSILLSRKTSFGLSSSVDGASFTCTLDGEARKCGTLRGLAAGTHVFTAAATAEGATDATPVTRTFTVPLNDRQLQDRGPWKNKTAGDAYRGTFSTVAKKGARLTTKVSDAERLALVVGTSRKAGRVFVLVNGDRIGAVSLKGKKAGKKVIELPAFDEALSGRVAIVTANGRTVRIEGLAVVTGS
ncbi:M12 family metallo-peptidase [Nocardioides dongkuii]|uniref:M12 family metallo-peptidase n=1 Tax=Nocardioides dongkuii TaxID=2760089 RepID=UPI001C70A901|nr:M12 family metallo-peptidase [Nocardioides dongkuii]